MLSVFIMFAGFSHHTSRGLHGVVKLQASGFRPQASGLCLAPEHPAVDGAEEVPGESRGKILVAPGAETRGRLVQV